MKMWEDLLIVIIITGYLGCAYAEKNFCKTYLQTSRRKERLFIVLVFICRLFLTIINEYCAIPHILWALLYHSIFVGFVLLLFQGEKEKKVLAASVLVTTFILAGNFCESFLYCLMLLLLHTPESPNLFLIGWEDCLIVCIRFMLTIGVCDWMSNHLRSVFNEKTKKWYILSAVPLFAITGIMEVANWGASKGIMIRSGGNMDVYYDRIFSHTEFCVLSALFMLGAGFYLFGMDRIYLEQCKSGQYHSQITAYKMLEEQYAQAERLRHDMKNHIIALSGLLEKKEWAKMENYLKKMEDCGSLGSGEEATGNRVVDALLYQKRKLAEQKNILWECGVQIPKKCSIDEFDLCVLFGNILDNAIEACERLQYGAADYDTADYGAADYDVADYDAAERGTAKHYTMKHDAAKYDIAGNNAPFINLQAKTVKGCFLLEMKNSFNIAENREGGFMKKSRKEFSGEHLLKHSQTHGIGLLNVKDMVERYNGIINIEAQDGIFEFSVMIPLAPLPNAGHNVKRTV